MSVLHSIANLPRVLRCLGNAAPAPAISEAQVRADVGRALAGELPITREPSSWGHGEWLTIEPRPGHRIIMGTTRQGKSSIDPQLVTKAMERDS